MNQQIYLRKKNIEHECIFAVVNGDKYLLNNILISILLNTIPKHAN